MATKRSAPEGPNEVEAPAAKKGSLGCGVAAKYFSYASTSEPDDSLDNSNTTNPGLIAQTPRPILPTVSRTNKATKPVQSSSSAFGSSTNQVKRQPAHQHEGAITQAPLRTPLDVMEVPGNMINRLDRKNRELQQTNQEQADKIRNLGQQLESSKNTIRERDEQIQNSKERAIEREDELEKSIEAWKQNAAQREKTNLRLEQDVA